MPNDLIEEARRQAQICNACRYCEGYCSVFPALHRHRAFGDGDITHLANLCHNCRGCYYACQYTAPHEFDLNIPQALANVRQESWKTFAWPAGFAHLFDRGGVMVAAVLIAAFVLLIAMVQTLGPTGDDGFYHYLSHAAMVAIFAPAFVLPLVALAFSLRRYWAATGEGAFKLIYLRRALASAATMKNLAGGHGDGCNFEDEDRFTHARRYLHQATLWGFLLCFLSTASGTILHYGFGLEAPYAFFSAPKLLGVPGGLLLCVGTVGLAWLKTKADPALGARHLWGGEMAFVMLLFAVSATGLVLYGATNSAWVVILLPVHLATVLTLFLLTPYSKMAHGFYRLAALAQEEARKKNTQ